MGASFIAWGNVVTMRRLCCHLDPLVCVRVARVSRSVYIYIYISAYVSESARAGQPGALACDHHVVLPFARPLTHPSNVTRGKMCNKGKNKTSRRRGRCCRCRNVQALGSGPIYKIYDQLCSEIQESTESPTPPVLLTLAFSN